MSSSLTFPLTLLIRFGLSLGWFQSTSVGTLPALHETPEAFFTKKMTEVDSAALPQVTLGMAESFLGTPYVAHTLDENAEEQLVCRFDGLDCTTLVDVAVALAIAKVRSLKYTEFLDVLKNLRYRDGTIDGYASRNHYFLEWRNQAIAAGLVDDVTRALGGVPFSKTINFMSTHPELYSSINSEKVLQDIRANEMRINEGTYQFLPKNLVRDAEKGLADGDIIGITSRVNGLDCNHQGIIRRKSTRAFLVHASTDKKKVVVSETPLTEYLNSVSRHTGIIVLRLAEFPPVDTAKVP